MLRRTPGRGVAIVLMLIGVLGALPFYYVGSSLAGWFGGWFFAGGGWPAAAVFVGALSALALLIVMKLAGVPPPAHLSG